MTIDFYTFNTPNGRKISVALEEMELPYKVHVVNITKDQQYEPSFLNLSPNNKIPAIVDRDGPGGAPLSVFESGAILLYLAREDGQVPAEGPARQGAGARVADVPDGRLRPDAGPGASLRRARERSMTAATGSRAIRRRRAGCTA